MGNQELKEKIKNMDSKLLNLIVKQQILKSKLDKVNEEIEQRKKELIQGV